MDPMKFAGNVARSAVSLTSGSRPHNPRVLAALLGPAVRGLVLQRGRNEQTSQLGAANRPRLDWTYARERPELGKLYEAAKQSQWDAAAMDWSVTVDPHDDERPLISDQFLALRELSQYRTLPKKAQQAQRRDFLAWLLSQFLHGEQGALLAACQVTEAVTSMDAKLYGSTQVVDEGRHIEVFERYLREKLEKVYAIDDNLYVMVDALLNDGRWDVKFLGMQILIEGLALGAFGTLRGSSQEPLLRELLRKVITDEARHVHFGVVALEDYYGRELPEKERREREDWAFEMILMMRDRFLAHEFYEEHWAQAMSRAEWDRVVMGSEFMRFFRETMFKRVIPNLRRIHLLSDRMKPHYDALGLMGFIGHKAAPELTVEELE